MRMPKIKQSENDVKKAIKVYLEFNGYKVKRINNGGIYRGKNAKGKDRYSFSGEAGVGDLYATKKADFPLWIETKKTGEEPTDEQYKFGLDVNATIGTYWIWADSFDMFLKKFNDINK